MDPFSHQERRGNLAFKAQVAENVRVDGAANYTDLILEPAQQREVRRDGWMQQFQRHRGWLTTGRSLILGQIKTPADSFANFSYNPVALRQDRANTNLPIALGLPRAHHFSGRVNRWRPCRMDLP